MQTFKYKGYNIDGKKIEGEIQAASPEEVERKAAANAVTVIAIYPVRKRSSSEESTTRKAAMNLFAKKAADADIAVILRDLSIMAETGVPFVEAIEAVMATAKTPLLRRGLARFKEEVVSGRGLSMAMKNCGIFPVIVSEMVRVAEEGGRLDQALATAASYVERSAALRKKIMNAMLYPIVLSVIAVITVGVLITFVLPRFAKIFESMNADVPPSTKMMLALGDNIKTKPLLIIGVAASAYFLLKFLWNHPQTSRAINRFLLKVPVLGELIRRLALSRALQTISTLISGNVALLSALEHGANVCANPVIYDAFMKARTSVEHGGSLSDSMSATRMFPSSLVQMISVGERTGRLGVLMKSTANYMEEDVDQRLKALVSIIEPIMIVIMGSIVGAITLSIIIPMYSVMQNVK
jgi:type IV pilus assembly protein PilC